MYKRVNELKQVFFLDRDENVPSYSSVTYVPVNWQTSTVHVYVGSSKSLLFNIWIYEMGRNIVKLSLLINAWYTSSQTCVVIKQAKSPAGCKSSAKPALVALRLQSYGPKRIFRPPDLDLWPRSLKINRLLGAHKVLSWTKFEVYILNIGEVMERTYTHTNGE